jgi:hypothetical protein
MGFLPLFCRFLGCNKTTASILPSLLEFCNCEPIEKNFGTRTDRHHVEIAVCTLLEQSFEVADNNTSIFAVTAARATHALALTMLWCEAPQIWHDSLLAATV